MSRMLGGILVLLPGLLPLAAGDERPTKPATPAEQYLAIAKDWMENNTSHPGRGQDSPEVSSQE